MVAQLKYLFLKLLSQGVISAPTVKDVQKHAMNAVDSTKKNPIATLSMVLVIVKWATMVKTAQIVSWLFIDNNC